MSVTKNIQVLWLTSTTVHCPNKVAWYYSTLFYALEYVVWQTFEGCSHLTRPPPSTHAANGRKSNKFCINENSKFHVFVERRYVRTGLTPHYLTRPRPWNSTNEASCKLLLKKWQLQMSTSVHSHSYSPGVGLCKTCGQNVTSQTGYKTWLCELGKKI
jgi:hypothetical protein